MIDGIYWHLSTSRDKDSAATGCVLVAMSRRFRENTPPWRVVKTLGIGALYSRACNSVKNYCLLNLFHLLRKGWFARIGTNQCKSRHYVSAFVLVLEGSILSGPGVSPVNHPQDAPATKRTDPVLLLQKYC